MRATPPSRRMSAGTRSSAITATAPESSATRACSGVTTSMITPPRSISARPRLTRAVPVAGPGAWLTGCSGMDRSYRSDRCAPNGFRRSAPVDRAGRLRGRSPLPGRHAATAVAGTLPAPKPPNRSMLPLEGRSCGTRWDPASYGPARSGPARYGPARSGPARYGRRGPYRRTGYRRPFPRPEAVAVAAARRGGRPPGGGRGPGLRAAGRRRDGARPRGPRAGRSRRRARGRCDRGRATRHPRRRAVGGGDRRRGHGRRVAGPVLRRKPDRPRPRDDGRALRDRRLRGSRTVGLARRGARPDAPQRRRRRTDPRGVGRRPPGLRHRHRSARHRRAEAGLPVGAGPGRPGPGPVALRAGSGGAGRGMGMHRRHGRLPRARLLPRRPPQGDDDDPRGLHLRRSVLGLRRPLDAVLPRRRPVVDSVLRRQRWRAHRGRNGPPLPRRPVSWGAGCEPTDYDVYASVPAG